ncbi:MAG: hypothetical protein M1816_001283 [Peltula sp. TS41687]|nr:MAG: hypothetical protein M1816_001283 [Peltula sp. TS41687]
MSPGGIGTWRHSPSADPADKQVVVAYISNTGRFLKELVDFRLYHRHGKAFVRLDAVELLEKYQDIAFDTTFEADPEGVLKMPLHVNGSRSLRTAAREEDPARLAV